MAAFKAFFRMYFRGFDASNQALISLLKKPDAIEVRYICLVILVQSFPEILAKALAMRPWTF